MKRRNVVIILGLIALWISAQFAMESLAGSSYSPDQHGVKAFGTLLEKLQVQVERLRVPFVEFPLGEEKKILLIAAPESFGNEAALLDWVGLGNTLVVADAGGQPLAKLRQVLNISRKTSSQKTWDAFKEIEPKSVAVNCAWHFDECRGVKKLTYSLLTTETEAPDFNPLVSDGKTVLVYHKLHKQGRIFYLSSLDLIKNDFIDKDDNLRLIFQIVSNTSQVWFDEFHHGFRAPVPAAQKARYGAAIIFALVLLFALLLAALSRLPRFGPALPTALKVPSSSTDFAAVLGLLYRDHQAASVLNYYARAWKDRMAQKFSLSPRLQDQAFIEELSRNRPKFEAQKAQLSLSLQRFSSEDNGIRTALSDNQAVEALEDFYRRQS